MSPRASPPASKLVLPLSSEAETALPAAARPHCLAIEPLSPQWISPSNESTGLIVGYAASSKPAFTGALQALLNVVDELPRQRL